MRFVKRIKAKICSRGCSPVLSREEGFGPALAIIIFFFIAGAFYFVTTLKGGHDFLGWASQIRGGIDKVHYKSASTADNSGVFPTPVANVDDAAKEFSDWLQQYLAPANASQNKYQAFAYVTVHVLPKNVTQTDLSSQVGASHSGIDVSAMEQSMIAALNAQVPSTGVQAVVTLVTLCDNITKACDMSKQHGFSVKTASSTKTEKDPPADPGVPGPSSLSTTPFPTAAP